MATTVEGGKTVQADLEALLALQADDDEVQVLEDRLSAIKPRIADLDRQRQVLADALDRAKSAVESEEKRQRELQNRVATHRTLHERNVSQLDVVRRQKETTAAYAQVEAARRMLAEEESELQTMNRRLHDLREAVRTQEEALATVDMEQEEARKVINEERSGIQRELEAATAKRSSAAAKVPRTLLNKYDRIRSR
jgi:predicted  nucleic acid-binding Zn-ribbon protein